MSDVRDVRDEDGTSAKKIRLAELTGDFLACAGKPILSLEEASKVSGWGLTTLRSEIARGLLIAARLHPDGNVKLSCRELARWYLSKERIR